MQKVSDILIDHLNMHRAPCALIVPMGGFSHQDCVGGAIEDVSLRQVFLEQVRKRLDSSISLLVLEDHIAAPEGTAAIIATLDSYTE